MTFPIHADNVAFGPRCLVTGGSGFLGAILVQRLLDLGLQVRSFDITPNEARHKNLESVCGDIRNSTDVEAACQDIDTVFHTAAVICLLSVYRKSVRDHVWSINVTGTENLVAAAIKQGVSQLIHTSSHNVCMDRELRGADESEPYATTFYDLYTETKVAAEKAVLKADNRNGLRTAAVRPGGIWGPGERSVLINKTVEQLVAGKFVATIGDPKVLTDCSHVNNVCDAEILAAQKLVDDAATVGGQPYFITDGEPYNQLRWIKPLVEMMGYKFPILNVPGAPMGLIATALEWGHKLGLPEPELTRSAIWKLTKDYYVSIDKARRELGYEPRIKRDDGLPDVLPFAQKYAAKLKAAG